MPHFCDYANPNQLYHCQMMKRKKQTAKSKSKINYYCGNCNKTLGKGSRKRPCIWCNVCGWVHFQCSGLECVNDYKNEDSFLCSKCKSTRELVDPTEESVAHSKLHSLYTSCNNPSAFGSRATLKKSSKCSYKQVDDYLNRSETYTKFKQTRNHFKRLKVQSYRLNEIWSVDLADMQRLCKFNRGIKYILVAVDTLSRFVWAVPLKRKTAEECRNALDEILRNLSSKCNDSRSIMQKPKFCQTKFNTPSKPEKIWVDKGREFAGKFSEFCLEHGITIYSTHSETKSAFAERNIRSLKAIIFKFMHENNTDLYIDNLQDFVNVINSRVNRITKLAPKDVRKSDVPYLISLQNSNPTCLPKFQTGQQVRIKRKIETFHRGYRIQFTEEIFTIVAVKTLNPPTYSIKDANNQLIQGKFYESELTRFEQNAPLVPKALTTK